MSIPVYKNSKVYVACSANIATGGPELLHQLAYNLRNELQIDAQMLYDGFDNKQYNTPVHFDYEHYNVPWTLEIAPSDDNGNNILIVPEVQHFTSMLEKYSHIRKGVWFLSVDNYYLSRMSKCDLFFQRLTNKILSFFKYDPFFEIDIRKLNLKNKKPQNDKSLIKASFYMTNSFRGLEWLEQAGMAPLFYLSEYINENFLQVTTDISKKENIVAYNPGKGFSFTKKIIKHAPNITFVPLIGMSRSDVVKTLQKSKVYIDFGNHPGKDRLPREAAILGCCVITGKRGSAGYYEDVRIYDEFKFDDRPENISKIVSKIKNCMDHFSENHKKFDEYREVIKNEQRTFIESLKKIFCMADISQEKDKK
ncbi:MAG: hypothetical protein P794_02065 [Epsilonproteobacteria bacterium (ex Lamellibrachia satsuma)]|nr:MAG: hypothetical protein P794_02065 [Epsilonproteobacteria bacterium (ex Lamellibrachia satsuma)]